MSRPSLLFLVLATPLIATALWRYTTMHALSPRRRFLGAALRCLITGLVGIVLLNPGLRFDLVQSRQSSPLILIDRSRSMQLFDPDSTERFITALARTTAGQKPTLMFFGDSLRTGTLPLGLPADTEALFPPYVPDNGRTLIISNGNWSNPSPPRSPAGTDGAAWVELPSFTPHPYLWITSVNTGYELQTTSVIVTLESFLDSATAIALTCRDGSRILSRRTAARKRGMSSDTVHLALEPGAGGRRLLHLDAASPGTGLRFSIPFVLTTLPQELRVQLVSETPRLDTRFLALAFSRDPQWILQRTAHPPPDLIVLFDWGERSIAALKRASEAAVLFAGCVPHPTPFTTNSGGRSTVLLSPTLSPVATPHDLPPPATLLRPDRPVLDPQTATRHAALISTKENDTSTLFATGYWQGRSAATLATRDVWRWDLRPHDSRTAPASPLPFTEPLLRVVREHLIASRTTSLMVYPATPPLIAGHPAHLLISLPGVPQPGLVSKLDLTVHMVSGTKVLDTSINIPPRTQLPVGPVVLPEGQVSVTAHLHRGGQSYTFADTFQVNADNSWLRITGANTLLLDTRGPRLPMNVDAAATFLYGKDDDKTTVVTQTVHIPRTLPLLLMLCLAICAEWYLRRRWKVD